jgi:hypothetical protein
VSIAQHGYQAYGSTAFMPLYPLLMSAATPLTLGSTIAGGLLVSTLAAFFCFVGIYRLADRLVPGRGVGPAAVAVTCLLPTAFYLMAAYTEALFLALATFAALAVLDRRWWHAALLGAAGALTRQQGVLLSLLPLPAFLLLGRDAVRASRSDGLRGTRVRDLTALLAAVAAPIGAYLIWLGVLQLALEPMPWSVLADPRTWNLRFAWPWQGLWADVRLLFVPGDPLHNYTSMVASDFLDLVMSLGALALLVAAFRRLPLGLVLYVAAMWWVSLSKILAFGPTISESRYMLQLLPLCVVPAEWLVRRGGVRRLAWVGISVPLLVLCTWGFALYLWIA